MFQRLGIKPQLLISDVGNGVSPVSSFFRPNFIIFYPIDVLCFIKIFVWTVKIFFGKQRVSSWLNLNILFCFVFRIFKQVFHFFNECLSLWVKFIEHFLVTIYKSIIVTAMSFLKKCCKYLAR